MVDQNTKLLLEIREIVNGHTKILNEHTRILDEHTRILDEHSKMLGEHSKKLDEHSKILGEHSDDIKSLKRTLFLIEDAVTNKIPALFDAYSLNQDKHDEFNARITNVENISDQNSLKISILEDKAKEHSRKLAKLSS